jgi:hypothetical protein
LIISMGKSRGVEGKENYGVSEQAMGK